MTEEEEGGRRARGAGMALKAGMLEEYGMWLWQPPSSWHQTSPVNGAVGGDLQQAY